MTDELRRRFREHFEPKYGRKLSDDEVDEMAENLTNVMELLIKQSLGVDD